MNEQLPVAAATCPECGKGLLRAVLIDETFEADPGGDEKVTVRARNVPVERCDRCGTELSGPPAATVRHEALCRAAGFYTPEEVKNLRTRLGLTREAFARQAGVGVATVSRVERGRLLQKRSTDNLFRLLAESEEARRLLTQWSGARGGPRTDPAGDVGAGLTVAAMSPLAGTPSPGKSG